MAIFGFGKKKQEREEERREQESPVPASASDTGTPSDAQSEEKKGLFSRLWQGLSKTRTNVAGRVDELVEATEEIDDDFY